MVFPKRCLNAASTQCSRKSGNTIVYGRGREINAAAAGIAAAARIPAAATGVHAATAARGFANTPDSAISDCYFPATTRGFCLQTSLYCEYFGAHVLWKDVFLQNAFATLSEDDMAFSRKNRVALQTLATAVWCHSEHSLPYRPNTQACGEAVHQPKGKSKPSRTTTAQLHNIHLESEEMPSCDDCRSVFENVHDLQRHVKKKGVLKTFPPKEHEKMKKWKRTNHIKNEFHLNQK